MHARYTIGTFCLAVTHTALAQTYHISDTYIGHDFFKSWNWETFDDPTHGRVNYVDQSTAISANLSFASDTKFFMRADSSQVVPPSARGRDSVRITSTMAYNDSVMALDLEHMPSGCGTWPAWWTLSQSGPWPRGGEIDIIEGVNQNSQNLASLHTSSQCTMPPTRSQDGSTVSTDCNTSVNNNQGCGTSFNRANSYGSLFNLNGGGWYIMHKSRDQGVNVWFWSRNDPDVPRAVLDGLETINPSDNWRTPDAKFTTCSCDYDTHFNAHNMIFDLTFCGDWAGPTFSSSGCGRDSCVDFVNNNPGNFEEAYWEINSLRVYT